MGKTKKIINKRKTVALILLATVIILPVSGAYIHVTHGEASSHKWTHIHALFGVIFIAASLYHIVYNWKILKHYLTGRK